MKVVHVNYFDNMGGSGRAAYRIHHALRLAGVESRVLVKEAFTSDWTVQPLMPARQKRDLFQRVQRKWFDQLIRRFQTANPTLHSPDVYSSVDVQQINNSDTDIVHLHWFNSGMVSIADIATISKPIVWTLHDMWAFCGAEHVTYEFRWKDGYRKDNRPGYESGFDLNRWTWERKRNYWKRPMHIVTPSHWLAQCVQQSALMNSWPVTVIPNAIDTDLWQPLEKQQARQILNLPSDVTLIVFGALGGGNDPNKGFDLLQNALAHLRGEVPGLELVIFGQDPPQSPPDLGFPVHYTGHLHDDISLRLLYSAADLLVIPSRLENLPNTGVEAHACGTPVVAFHVGGLPDIVEHLHTGYLAKPYDTADLAHGIQWVLGKREEGSLGQRARERAVERFSGQRVAEQYLAVYQQVVKGHSPA
jgi:glycosyltransferase involved in cell wall biosynthesis